MNLQDMDNPKQLFTTKFTVNTRTMTAVIAICLAAYGLTMLNWLETSQQRGIQLNPRKEAPDFLVTNARYLDFQPEISSTEATQPKTIGLLRLDIQSKTLSHYTDIKKTVFQKPVMQFIDKNKKIWLMTSETATATAQSLASENSPNTQTTETIQLQDNVHLTALSQAAMSMDSDQMTIDITNETLQTSTDIKMDFQGGQLTAGRFKTSLKSGTVLVNKGVQAIYHPQKDISK